MIILGIETSCDETAVALVSDKTPDTLHTDQGNRPCVLAHRVFTQLEEHEAFGGVVPEVAARAHLQVLPPLLKQTLKDAKLTLADIDGVAVTCGPGLIGGVMVGVMMGKSIAAVHNKPFLAINHLAGHGLVPRLSDNLSFPYLLLLVSGGHSQIVVVKSALDFEVLGSTQDDAVGECFDKCAKMMGLPYPGGANVEKAALTGDKKRFQLPRPLKGRTKDGMACRFSFSGLKSAVRREIEKLGDGFSPQDACDLSAGLQTAISDTLCDRLKNALKHCDERSQQLTALVVSGGVAANVFLRDNIKELAHEFKLPFVAPPLNLCTDNGVMIAWAGIEKMKHGSVDALDFKPRPRWPLNELSVNEPSYI
ncbi:MAG: tRNA (adenosine(37)-N6)-threonylcarbamoyltransferase complex transferase subunit TsaD [Alphaproteobacteria bacterium]|nr:tRNA (adenosine(37)-N6)-threonylcarbamoyltransferase complex transferase subunit TsaD [Alphaproteobacteria bacterium]NCQ67173.1 tRNA (adenosine(37)-N6)-threonylcarbamoyltransferase complex transferase subunit TsaD [Alphaproteobacteria bacterium]NCT07018.1 tRNA (adenosine(37)-N6)-threonylcarbamoyltransferase complex transferase subunit TsaD [Alphaproteobacteria bacterium]